MRDAQRHAGFQRVERVHDGHQRLEFHQLVGHDPQPVFPAVGDLPHALCDARDILREPGGFFCQQFAGTRQLQAVAAAVEQECVEALLQLPRGVRHRGRRLAQPGRRARQAAGLADGLQQGQFVFRQHVRLLRTCSSD